MQIIEIDGKKYMPKPQKQTSRSGSTGKLLMAAMTLATPYDPYVGIDRFFKKRPAVDIAAEYQLIQQKKSKLSRSDREWVQRTFHDKYIEVKEDTCQ